MRHILALLTLVAGYGLQADGAELRQRAVSGVGLVDDHVIVGRAQCATSTWLLTDAPALVQIRLAERSAIATPVKGFSKDERPWGLACVHGSLWTLADYRSLAQLSFTGDVVGRLKLRQPRLGLFGAGEWLLLQQPPAAGSRSLLSMVDPRDVNRAQPWPGITASNAQATSTSATQSVGAGLVACGLPSVAMMPCWLASHARISISDGSALSVAVVEPQFLRAASPDPSVPLWDVALAGAARLGS